MEEENVGVIARFRNFVGSINLGRLTRRNRAAVNQQPVVVNAQRTDQNDQNLTATTTRATRRPKLEAIPEERQNKLKQLGGVERRTLNLKGVDGKPKMERMDPSERSQDDEYTRNHAERQTLAARTLLRHPGEAAQEQLGKTASGMLEILDRLKPSGQAGFFARVLGEEGAMPGAEVKDAIAALERVAQTPETATAMDRIITVALSGDLGALFADTRAKPMPGRTKAQEAEIRKGTLEVFPEMTHAIEVSKAFGTSSMMGPRKKPERDRTKEKYKRTGVHNTGEAVDRKHGVTDTKEGQKNYIRPMGPQLALIPEIRVAQTEEPFVGHISGSPHEIVTTMHVLGREEVSSTTLAFKKEVQEGTKTGKIEKEETVTYKEGEAMKGQRARVALANAFLIGNGLHSALETLEGSLKLVAAASYTEDGAKAYEKQNNPTNKEGFFVEQRAGVAFSGDMGAVAYEGAATDIVVDGMEHFIKPEELKLQAKKEKPKNEKPKKGAVVTTGKPRRKSTSPKV